MGTDHVDRAVGRSPAPSTPTRKRTTGAVRRVPRVDRSDDPAKPCDVADVAIRRLTGDEHVSSSAAAAGRIRPAGHPVLGSDAAVSDSGAAWPERESAIRPSRVVQRMLAVGRSDDSAERAADEMADVVVRRLRGAGGPAVVDGGFGRIQRMGHSALVTDAAGPDGGAVAPDVESRIRRSTGRPIPPDVRGQMESAFGTDLSAVRIHTGASADRLSTELGARAFTTGSDVFFRRGEYRPRDVDGRRVLAHELTHTIQQGGTVKRVQRVRAALTTAQVMTALNRIDFVAAKLQQHLHGTTMESRVTEMLQSWQAHVATKTNPDVDLQDAMMLSTALEGVARIIAEDLNDVSVQPVVAQKLFELYRTEVGSKVKKQRADVAGATRQKVLDLTGALVADDPVTRFLHREISLRKAAASIRAMAGQAQAADPNVTTSQIFELMEQRFQVKMATYRSNQLHAHDKAARFSARESPGEYSSYFFEKMFGANAFAGGDQLAWTPKGAGTADRLAMDPATEASLLALRTEVLNPAAAPVVAPRAGLTTAQAGHLQNIEAAEQQIDLATMKSAFVSFFRSRYFLTGGAADQLYTDVTAFLRAAPLTITVSAEQWFGKKKPPDPRFSPSAARTAKTSVSSAFGKRWAKGKIEHLPTWDDEGLDDGAKRGAKYLRFRAWKDELMSGLNGLPAQDMAVFGALNVNYDLTKGSDAVQQPGRNYYGNLHFVLDRNRVQDRMIYTATDHGAHRRNPLLALHDFTFGGLGITWLKDTKKLAMIDNIVNAVRSRVPLYGLPLLFEIQIFGGVNVRDDVTAVHLAPDVTPQLEAAVRAYYQNHLHVAVTKGGAAPPNSIQTQGDVDEMLMAELVASASLDANSKRAIAADVAGTRVRASDKKDVQRVLTVVRALKETADADHDSLTALDITNLEAGLAKINLVAGPLINGLNAKGNATDAATITARVQAAAQSIALADTAVKNRGRTQLRQARRGQLQSDANNTGANKKRSAKGKNRAKVVGANQ